MTARLRRRHGRPRTGPARRRAARLGDDPGDRLPDRGPDRLGPRLPGERRRLLPRAQLRRLREALQSRSRRDGSGRGGGHRFAQGGSARLRALEGPQGGRGHLLGLALGPGPARLAHRVLGDVGEGARPRLRDPRRRHRPRLPAPRERDRADRGRRGASRSPRSGCTTAWCSSTRRRCRSPSATSSSSRRPSSATAAQTVVAYLISGHYRQPLAFSDEQLAGGRGSGRADPQLPPRRPVGRAGRVPAREAPGVPRCAGRRLQHPAGLRGPLRDRRRGEQARADRRPRGPGGAASPARARFTAR